MNNLSSKLRGLSFALLALFGVSGAQAQETMDGVASSLTATVTTGIGAVVTAVITIIGAVVVIWGAKFAWRKIRGAASAIVLLACASGAFAQDSIETVASSLTATLTAGIGAVVTAVITIIGAVVVIWGAKFAWRKIRGAAS